MRLFQNWNKPKVYRRRILFEQLEERIVLDAAVTPQPTNTILDNPEPTNTQQLEQQENQVNLAAGVTVAPLPPPPTPAGEVFHQDLNVVLISNALDKIPEISQGAMDAAKVFTYDALHDNLITIVGELQEVSKTAGQKIDNLAIIGHGAENAMRLGTDRIDFSNVGHFSSELSSLGQALSDQAQIQLFTCSLAKDASGKAFVDSIGKLTGADVYASDDNTGGAKGDWTLEYGSDSTVAIKPILDAQYLTNIHTDLTYAPELTISGTAHGAEDTVVDLSNLVSVKDQDANETVTVTLTANQGFSTLEAFAQTGATVTGHNTSTITVEGSQTAVNETLNHLTGALVHDWNSSDGSQATVLVNVSDNHGNNDGSSSGTLYASIDTGPVEAGQGVHVLVVSSAIQSSDQLIQATADGVLTVTYDPMTDSPDNILLKIETMLAGHKADSIAFATHDQGPGQFYLTGDYSVNSSTLLGSPELQHFWKDIGSLVNDNGRIDLLACGLGSNETGKLLLSQLESMVGRNFAASDDATGNAQYGGDWVLESDGIDVGPVYFLQPVLNDFNGLLVNLPPVLNLSHGAGSLDPTFGSDGLVTTDFGGSSNFALAVAIQADGKIVEAGGGNSSFALARYNSDGTLDTSFSDDGKLTTFFATSSHATSVAMQADGKIVVAGATNKDFALARYNSNGSLDTTFDADGKVTTDIIGDNSFDSATSVAMQADGKIVVAGYTNSGSTYYFALARYNSNGTLDYSFSDDGKLTTAIGNVAIAESVVIQADGKIVVAGYSNNGNKDFALARYNSDGSLDTTFSGDGILTNDIGSSDFLASVDIQTDGKIVVGGSANYAFALARYNSDGSLDTTFSGDGLLTTNIGDGVLEDSVYSVAVQSNGKIIAAGRAHIGSDYDFALARYNSDGSLDTNFGIGGKLTTDIGSSRDDANSVAIQVDGKIVAAGTVYTGSISEFVVVRYDASQLAYIENAGGQATDNAITLTDSDNTSMASAKIQITGNYQSYQDTLGIALGYSLPVGVTATWDGLTGKLTLNGVAATANYDLLLEHVTYTNSSDSPNTSPRTVTWTVTDDGMVNSVPQTSTITVTAVNDSPAATGPVATTSLNEDGSASITVYGTDVDNPALSDVSFAITSDVHNGTLVAGSTSLDSSGHYSKVYTYTPNANFNGSDPFEFTFTAKSETSSATDTTSAVSVPITVTAVNDVPITQTFSVNGLEDAAVLVQGWKMNDAEDGNNVAPSSVVISSLPSHGTLLIDLGQYVNAGAVGSNTHNASSMALGDVNGDGNLDLVVGDPGQTNKVYLNDGHGVFACDGSLGDVVFNTRTIALGDINGDGILDAVVGNDYQPMIVFLNDGHGVFAYSGSIGSGGYPTPSIKLGDINGDGSLDLVAVKFGLGTEVYTNDSHGTFTYSGMMGLGTNWTHDIALGDVNGDSYLDVIEGNWNHANKIYLNDKTGHFNFFSDITSAADATGSIRVGDVNNDGHLDVVAGNWGAGYKLYLNNGDGTFRLGQAGEGMYTNAVQLGDVNRDGYLDIVEANWNQFGKVYINQGAVDGSWQGFGAGSSIGDGTDLGQSLQLGDVDNGGYLDVIVGNHIQPIKVYENGSPITLNQVIVSPDFDSVKFVPDANWNGTTTFAYKAVDFDGGTSAGAAIVSINIDVFNGNPTALTLSNNSVNENLASGATIGTFTTTDPDSSDIFTYSLVSGTGSTDNGSFTIVGNTLKTNAIFDHETKDTYAIRVRTTDLAGASYEKQLTVNVGDVNETPTVLTLSNNSVNENQASGATIGTFTTTDPDSGDTFTYSLVSGVGSTDNGSFKIEGNTLKTNASFDHEAKDSYTIRVRTTDLAGASYEKQLTVNVGDVNDAPTSPVSSAVTTLEDTPYTFKASDYGFDDGDGDTLQKIKITVLEIAGTLKYDGTDVTAGLEIATADIAKMTFDPAFNANGDGYSTFKFMVSDGTDYSVSDYTMTINVTAVNDAPILSLSHGAGSLDATFSSDGKVTGPGSQVKSMAAQSDGKIVVAGKVYSGSGTVEFALARYNSDGSLDTNFGIGGEVITAVGGSGWNSFANSVAIQEDGKIVVAGEVYLGSLRESALVRYNSDGSLDTNFGIGGEVITAVGSHGLYATYSVAIQEDCKLVLAGGVVNDYGGEFALARYNSDGSLDTTFGIGGVITAFNGYRESSFANSVAIQEDGKIVASGHMHGTTGNVDFALARYNSDGSLDTSFDHDGKVTTDVSWGTDYANSVAIQEDGKIVASGQGWNFSINNFEFALARYNSDGSLDTNFGTGGKVLTDVSGQRWPNGSDSMVIQPDGKLVLAGYVYNKSTNLYEFALARYNSDGSLDTNFGTGGEVITDVGGSGWGSRPHSVAVQADGNIVVAGEIYNGSHGAFTLVRYNASHMDYTENAPPQIIDGAITLTDIDNDNMVSAKIEITVTGNYLPEDTLSIDPTYLLGDVHANFEAGILTLTGSTTKANYESMLEHVTYTNSSDSPNTSPRTVTWTVTDDGMVNSVPQTSTITVTAFNDLPAATGPVTTTSLNEDGSTSITVHGTDVDNPALSDVSFAITPDVHNGTLVAGDTVKDSPGHYSKVYTYTPTANFNGSDPFEFTFTTKRETSSATDTTSVVSVPITVTAFNDLPAATGPVATTSLNQDGTASITVYGTDVDNPALSDVSFAVTSNVAHGNLVGGTTSLDSAGHYSKIYTYTPSSNFNGSDSFAFTFTTKSETSSATDTTGAVSVPITVNAMNHAPTVSGPASNVRVPNGQIERIVLTCDDGDLDQNQMVTMILDTPPSNGTLHLTQFDAETGANQLHAGSVITAISNGGNQTLFFKANTNGSDTFTFHARDNGGGLNDTSGPASVRLTVNNAGGVNPAPPVDNNPVQPWIPPYIPPTIITNNPGASGNPIHNIPIFGPPNSLMPSNINPVNAPLSTTLNSITGSMFGPSNVDIGPGAGTGNLTFESLGMEQRISHSTLQPISNGTSQIVAMIAERIALQEQQQSDHKFTENQQLAKTNFEQRQMIEQTQADNQHHLQQQVEVETQQQTQSSSQHNGESLKNKIDPLIDNPNSEQVNSLIGNNGDVGFTYGPNTLFSANNQSSGNEVNQGVNNQLNPQITVNMSKGSFTNYLNQIVKGMLPGQNSEKN